MSSSSAKFTQIPQKLYIPLIDFTAFDNIQIDNHSLDLVENGALEQRYAVVGFIDEEDKKTYLYFRPSFTMIDGEDEEKKQDRRKKQKGREKFNLEDIIEAPSDVPGIVHHHTIASIREYFKTRNMYFPHLKVNKIVGLSFRKNSKNILNWLSRSTLNYSVCDTNPIASVCFHFPSNQSNFFRPQYLGIYNLQRTLEKVAFDKIREATKNSLLKEHELNEIPNEEKEKYQEIELRIQESNKEFGMDEWLEIQESKEKIAEYMMGTIFFASGLLPSGYEHSPFQPNNFEVIQNVLKIAMEYEIPLNLNYIPKTITSNDNSFVHACKNGDLESVNLLLNYEAKQGTNLNKSVVSDFKIKNKLLAESLFKYCELNKIKMSTVQDIINDMKQNIQFMYPEINEPIQNAKLSETIYSYTTPKKTLLEVVIDLDHFDMARLLVMYSTDDILNNAFIYTIQQSKLEFIKIMLRINFHIFDQQKILVQSALTGNLDIIQFIKSYGIKLLDDIAITKFNENVRKGLISVANTGEYLKVKQLKDEFKIEFTEKYDSKDEELDGDYTLTDKLFEIFITHISEDNLNAVLELQKHLYEIFINHINRNEFHEEKCEKHTFALKSSIECGAINLLQFLLPYHKEIEQQEKQRMLNDSLASKIVKYAYYKNYIEIIKILNNHSDISAKSINYRKESIEGVLYRNFRLNLYNNDLADLKKILYFFPKLFQEFLNKNDNGYPILVAISHSSNEVIEFLLKNNNIDLEVSDQKGNTLLLAAARELNHFPIVSLLLEKGANKEAVNHEGMSISDLIVNILIYAAENDKTSHIKLIVETCKKHNIFIELNKPSKISGKNITDCFIKLFFKHVNYGLTYFLSEGEKCFPEIFKQFLISQNSEGNSPIMIAASRRHQPNFSVLINKKMDLELINAKGNTVLLITSLHANLEFISKLLEKKVNQDAKNFDGLNFKDCLMDGLCKELNVNINFISDINKFEDKHPKIIDYYKLFIKLLPKTNTEKLKFIVDNIKEEHRPTLKNLIKLDQLVQQLNSIPDCKAIKVLTKDVYSNLVETISNPEDLFNTLLNNARNLSNLLQKNMFYRGVSRVYITNENLVIKEKLDHIINKFSNEVALTHRNVM